MRHIEFTEEELKQMAHESVYHEHPIIRRRMQALLLKSDDRGNGYPGDDYCLYLHTDVKGSQ